MAILPEIEKRRSVRLFTKETVRPEPIRDILWAARHSPSCFNKQPARFVVVTGKALKELHAALPEGNAWARQAPIMIAVVSEERLGCRSKGRLYYLFDSGLATENLIIQAFHSGLAAHPMLGFDEEKAKKVLGIPEDYRVIALVAVGHPDPEEKLEDKPRKPLDEIAFHNSWGYH